MNVKWGFLDVDFILPREVSGNVKGRSTELSSIIKEEILSRNIEFSNNVNSYKGKKFIVRTFSVTEKAENPFWTVESELVTNEMIVVLTVFAESKYQGYMISGEKIRNYISADKVSQKNIDKLDEQANIQDKFIINEQMDIRNTVKLIVDEIENRLGGKVNE